MPPLDFARLARAYLDSLEDPESRRLRIEQELLTVARDGTVSYSYTFSDYLKEWPHLPRSAWLHTETARAHARAVVAGFVRCGQSL